VRRFIFLSSIKVNGESTLSGNPFAASDKPHPSDPYGQSKWEAEQALFELGTQSGMEVVVIRPPLVYGPGVKANFASMMNWVRRGVPLPFGRLDNRRSLIFVRNLADFVIACASRPDAANHTFLVSDGRDLSVAELLCKLSENMGSRSRLFSLPPRLLGGIATLLGQGPAARRLLDWLQLDISETREATGWTPPYTVDEGLRQTVKAFLEAKNRA
jgi:UDP-glucose 4-epimerase